MPPWPSGANWLPEDDLTLRKWPRFCERIWQDLDLEREVSMSRKRYTPEQIIGMLRQAEVELAQGRKVPEVCWSLGVSERSY